MIFFSIAGVGDTSNMSQLTLRFSVVEKNDRGQEVELVRKALQFKPQVRPTACLYKILETNISFTQIIRFFWVTERNKIFFGSLK